MLLESPNWASRLRRTRGARWIDLRPLEHVVHWTPETLGATLRRAGLEPVSVRTLTWRSELHTPLEAATDIARPGLGMVVWAVARVR